MRNQIFRTTLPLLALATLLILGGPIACSKDDQPVETDTEAELSEAGDSGDSGDSGDQPTGEPVVETPMSVEEIPDVVARMGDEEISKTELLEYSEGLRQRLVQNGMNPGPPTAEFYRSALHQMIGGTLLYNDARAKGQEATDAEVTAQIDSMKSRFPSPEAFAEAMASQGVTDEMMRDEIRRGLSVQNLIDKEIATQVSLAPDAERNYYDANPDQMRQPEQVNVRHILIAVTETATDEQRAQARAKAEEILGRARGGEDFAALARENSDDPGSAPRGGDLSWIARGQTVPPFEQAAFAMQPGDVSDVVVSSFGFHIIRMEERRAEATMPFEEVSQGIRQMLMQRAVENAIDDRIAALRIESDAEIFI